jgi:predicted PurR-regulated permease PerM
MQKKKINFKVNLSISVLMGLLGAIIGFCIFWQSLIGDTAREIENVEKRINDLNKDIGKVIHFSMGEMTMPGCSWDELEIATSTLTIENEITAIAKALTRYKEKPKNMPTWGENIWDEREIISNRDWEVQSLSSKIMACIGVAFVYLCFTSISVFLLLIFIPCLWYFLLERIGELSNALRGK